MPEKQLLIDDFSFGRLRILGADYREDLLLVDGRVKADWWRQHGHRVVADDVTEILTAHPDVLVVGNGLSNQMQVDPSLTERLEREGIQLISEPTEQAVATYNRLVQKGARVAGAFHLTC